MEDQNLYLLINEEIYLLPEDRNAAGLEIKQTEIQSLEQTDKVVSQVSEPEPSLAKTSESNQTEENQPPSADQIKGSPKIPSPKEKDILNEKDKTVNFDTTSKQTIADQEFPLSVFHSSSEKDEKELLGKIISACKVPEDQYSIFSNGFDQAVKFKKALVFVPEAKAFYTPIPYKGSYFLCSKPLSHLMSDQSEKAKLWTALQKFVLE